MGYEKSTKKVLIGVQDTGGIGGTQREAYAVGDWLRVRSTSELDNQVEDTGARGT